MNLQHRWILVTAALVLGGCLVWAAAAEKSRSGVVPAPAASQPLVWQTDFAIAKTLAAQEDRPILALFDGSDWCPWCIRLRDEVLSTSDFAAYAGAKLVLFEADFPVHKDLPAAEVKQNNILVERYGIEGFPTVLILDKEGKELARTGYKPGGGTTYVEHLKTLLADAQRPANPGATAAESSDTTHQPAPTHD
jgi:protein disulfide-isomerase